MAIRRPRGAGYVSSARGNTYRIGSEEDQYGNQVTYDAAGNVIPLGANQRPAFAGSTARPHQDAENIGSTGALNSEFDAFFHPTQASSRPAVGAAPYIPAGANVQRATRDANAGVGPIAVTPQIASTVPEPGANGDVLRRTSTGLQTTVQTPSGPRNVAVSPSARDATELLTGADPASVDAYQRTANLRHAVGQSASVDEARQAIEQRYGNGTPAVVRSATDVANENARNLASSATVAAANNAGLTAVAGGQPIGSPTQPDASTPVVAPAPPQPFAPATPTQATVAAAGNAAGTAALGGQPQNLAPTSNYNVKTGFAPGTLGAGIRDAATAVGKTIASNVNLPKVGSTQPDAFAPSSVTTAAQPAPNAVAAAPTVDTGAGTPSRVVAPAFDDAFARKRADDE